MAIKDLLVAYDGSAGADAALRMGAALARRHGAKLTGLLAHGAAADYAASARWMSAETRAILEAANSAVLDEARAQFAARAAAEGLADVPLLSEAGRPDLIVSDCAKYHDLTLLGRFDEDAADARLILHPDRIALRTGRPLLVVPAGFEREVLQSRALVAWDGGRSAARALADAMQILEGQAQVTVLTIGDGPRPAPGRDIETHLANHGVTAEWVRLSKSDDVGRTLLDYADDHAPDLIVMGAYEHSKFREDFFGGVTDTVLRRTTAPVLLSH